MDVVAGAAASWLLPDIVEGNFSLKEVLIEPDAAISPYLSYEAQARKIVLAEDPATLSLVSDTLTYPFVIRLVDVRDFETVYSISV